MKPEGNKKKTIFIASSIHEWGGSEELWSKTVPYLQERGYHVVACRSYIENWHPKTASLIQQGVEFLTTHSFPSKPLIERLYKKVINKVKKLFGIKTRPRPIDKFKFDRQAEVMTFNKSTFIKHLKAYDTKLVLVSQGGNFDGMIYAQACLESNIPYVIVSHKAVDFYWPPSDYREGMREVWAHAAGCYFVSEHNKRLTEEQFGIRLPDSKVIFNPVKPTQHIPYPDTKDVFQLCCIGRLFILEKGQDLLIRALSQEKWKNRPVKVSIIGSGPDERTLKDLVKLLGATNVSLVGQVSDIYEVWKHSHALVLPSRTEGLPLVIVEAMMAGRPVITTDVGGNKEFLEEGVTGFVGYASDVPFEETLERAWQQRERWKDMGERAAVSIRKRIPELPERIFADLLESHIDEQ